MGRSIRQQFNYAISQNLAFGRSKHNDKINPNISTYDRTYSLESAGALRDMAKNFSNFMGREFPEIRLIRDIQPQHVQQFFNKNCNKWSDKTIESYTGRMEKLEHYCQRAFGRDNISFMEGVQAPVREHREQIRDRAMERTDFDRIRQDLQNSRSNNGLRALEITARCGLRVREVACLRVENINLQERVIHIREGAKNGKPRDVQIREKDLPFFKNLKENTQHEYVCRGVQPNSLNRAIRDAMKRCGLSEKYALTTEHSVRKMYAGERFQEEIRKLGEDTPENRKKAWEVVQQELGHGSEFRPELYNTYVGHVK